MPATLCTTPEEINLAIVDTLQLPSYHAVQGLLVHLQVESHGAAVIEHLILVCPH